MEREAKAAEQSDIDMSEDERLRNREIANTSVARGISISLRRTR